MEKEKKSSAKKSHSGEPAAKIKKEKKPEETKKKTVRTKKAAETPEKPKKIEKKKEPVIEEIRPSVEVPVKTDGVQQEQSEKDLELSGKPERYWEAVGRRKTAIARVRLFTRGEKTIIVNDKPYGTYFPTVEQQKTAEDSLQKMKSMNRFRVSVKVSGGGLKAQAEAIRHGTARALVEFNPDFRKRLRRAGFMTRDPRMKERKKFGLKSARRAPQWAKR